METINVFIFFGTLGFVVKVTPLTVTGSSSYAVLGQPFRLTCAGTGTTHSPLLVFRRGGSGAPCSISNPFTPSCSRLTNTPGYNCSCGQSGMYYMNISSVGQQDEGDWLCEIGTNTSNLLPLSVYYGPFNNVTLSRTSPVTVIEGVTTGSVRCSALCKPDCSYTWRRGNQQGSDNRDLSLGSLRRGQEGYYICRVRNTLTNDTADSPTVGVDIKWYPAQPTHNCPAWIVSGQTASCTCQTSDPGNPTGTIMWRDTQGQTVNSSPVLNLANIPTSDNGKSYTCRAANSLRNSYKDTAYSVNIAFGPTRVNITGNRQTNAPDVLNLTCTTDLVNPTPTLTWRNSTNGSNLSGSSTVPVGSPQDGTLVYGSTLSIRTQWYQDGETIVCEGRNPRIQSMQTVTDSEVLNINYPPQSHPVISGLPGSEIYEGDSVTLTCRVTGGKPLVTTVTLRCPGGHQSSATTSEGDNTKLTTLTFRITWDLRSQPCTCSAVHSTGRYRKTAEMTNNNVYYPPTIQNVSITPRFPWLEGSTGSLTCDLSDAGHPRASYVWYRDGVRDSSQTGQTWQFSSLSYKDNGRQISCQAENQFTENRGSTVKSSNVTLSVFFPPKVQTLPSSSVMKIEGSPLTVNCTAFSNPQPTVYQWSNGHVAKPGGSQLSFPDLDRSDHGEYRCTVTTVAGSYGSLTGTATIQVIVNYSPDLNLTNVSQKEGRTATVTCLADGRPDNFSFSPFVHTWRGHVIRHVNGLKNKGQYEKVFSSSTFEDSGVYICEVDNGIPDRNGLLKHRGNISVQIKASPKLTVGMEVESRVGAEVGENLTLFKTFYSTDNISKYQWTKDNQILNSSRLFNTTVQLNIYGVVVEEIGYNLTLFLGPFDLMTHPGQYFLNVCNSVDCTSTSVTVTAAGPPLVPLKLMVISTTQSSISLRWKPNFPGGDFTQVFILYYRQVGSGGWKTREYEDNPGGYVYADIKGLHSGSVYEFRVRARSNREGNVMPAGKFTEIVLGETKNFPQAEQSIGVGLGIGLGICIPIIIGLVLTLIYFFRRRNLSPQSKGHPHQPENLGTGGQYGGSMTDESRNLYPTEYAHLEQRGPEHYEHIKLYENTKGTSGNTTEYENLQQKASTTYEKVESPMYVNSVKDANDPTYINTRKAQQSSNI